MDKGEQPTIWAGHNFNQLTEEAFLRNEKKEKAQAVGAILDRPDRNEENTIGFLSENALSRLSWALGKVFEVNLASGPCDAVKVKLFNPHQCVKDNPSTLPVEVHTSVVACDAYAAWEKNKAKVIGSILLFKLSANLINDPVPDMTAKDLVWGENCTYGAFVNGDAINYFEITQTSGDVVQSELRRKDPTEKSGQSVEMQVVRPGQDRLIVQKLPSSSDEAFNLEQELDKFIASRPARTDCFWRWLVVKWRGN